MPVGGLFSLSEELLARFFVARLDGIMTRYPPDVEHAMITFFGSLREKDRRRYAAVEAAKLGTEGVLYLSRLLDIDPKTIRQGIADLHQLPDVPPQDVRKKGADESRSSTPPPN